jgi:hypothetical protein
MSLSMGRLCQVCLVLTGLAAPVSAQTADSLVPGMRVRVVQSVAPRKLAGSVHFVGDTSFSLVPDGSSVIHDIPLSTMLSLEAAAGTRRPLTRGALWGGIVGLAIGTTLVLAEGECIDCVDGDSGGGPVIIGFTTIIGSLFGLAAGSVTRQDRWRRISTGGLDYQ